MSSLLDDLLDVSRITRGSFLLKKEYVDVRVLIDDAVEAVRGALEAKRHTLRVNPPEAQIRARSRSGAHHAGHHELAHQCR